MSEIVKLDVAPQILDAQQKAQPSRVLWQGTVAIREYGNTYLKKSLFEQTPRGENAYKLRLDNAVLKNKFKTTVNYIQGQIFRKPLMLVYRDVKDDVKEFFEKFKEDVDNKNDDWNVFLKTSLKNGLIDGVSYVMIDTPQFTKSVDGRRLIIGNESVPNNLESVDRYNLRPYWIQIELKDVMSVKVDWINGKKEYTEFIYRQNILGDDKTTRSRIYRYTRDEITIYAVDADGKQEVESTLVNNFGFIPVSLFMCGEPTSDYTALPTLTDLAQLNIAHYNAYSEHQSLMRYDRNPLWLAKELSGIDENGDKQPLVLGPGAGISGNVNSDLKSVGVDTQSVIQSMNDLADLEKAMDEYTSSLTTSQNMTAEQVDLISGSSDCQIKNWATTFKDFIEDLLCNTAIIAGYNKEGDIVYPQVIVNNEFRKPFDYQQATLLQDMVSQGQLSNKTYLSILKSMSVFDDDFDVDEELEELGLESSNSFKEPPKE